MSFDKVDNNVWKTLTTFALILAYYATFSLYVFPEGPVDFDEYGYFQQAKLFAEGKLVHAADKLPHRLWEPHIRWSGEGYYSKYPPGSIFYLALFMLVGLFKLASPVAVTLGLFFSYKITRRFLGQNASLIIVFLGAISPYATGYAASLYSQPLAFLLCTIVLWAFIEHKETSKRSCIYVMGLSVSYLFLTRPTDACITLLCIGIAILIAHPFKRALKILGGLVPLALSGLALFTAYYSIIHNKLKLFSYKGYVSQPMSIGEDKSKIEVAIIALEKYIDRIDTILIYLFNKKFFPLVGDLFFLMAIVGLLALVVQRRYSILALFIALTVGLYHFHYAAGWPSYGARYWYVAFGAFLCLAALGWWAISSITYALPKGRIITALLATFLVAYQMQYMLTQGVEVKEFYKTRFTLRENAMMNMLSECPEKSLIVVMPRIENSPANKYPFVEDLFLNHNAFGDRKRIVMFYSRIKNEAFIRKVQRKFPDYDLCPYQPNHAAPQSRV